jgi:hypothetical protein
MTALRDPEAKWAACIPVAAIVDSECVGYDS